MKAKKLIEVALPIKEISAESVRDKSIRHGHISTLHLWWARRPLPVCRAIVFASLVPDPLDENCPEAFQWAVHHLLCKGHASMRYKPYKDIPYTSIVDEMPDNHRNRLMMFIGQFSDKCQKNMIAGKPTLPKEQLSDYSLIKWENKNNPDILRIARELIFVAYQSDRRPDASWEQLHDEFNRLYDAIPEVERQLYELTDRHLSSLETEECEAKLKAAIEAFQNAMPSVFDPFAGGGAIPLEAARLGCRSYGNDINPVAHIIERGSAEFPQRYGKPIIYSKVEFERLYGEEGIRMAQETERDITFEGETQTYRIPNRLAFDVEYYAKRLLAMVEDAIGKNYPSDERGNVPIAFYWARTAKCSNPSCQARVPLLKQFYLANTKMKKVYLNPIIEGKSISFEIKNGACEHLHGWNNKGTLTCPCCGSVTDKTEIRRQSVNGELSTELLAVINETSSGKGYALPSNRQRDVVEQEVGEIRRPTESMAPHTTGGDISVWGYKRWGDLFSERQLQMLYTFVNKLTELRKELGESSYTAALVTYLAIWIDRIAVANTSLGRWDNAREGVQTPFSRQAIAMTFDYPESNPFCTKTGSAMNQMEWILRYIEQESSSIFPSIMTHTSSGEKEQFAARFLTAVVTDPPYYDAIAYADISDFFYVWLKRTLGNIYPLDFATPQTPKTEECTALKHHHNNSEQEAKRHFESKLTQIFDAIEQQTSDVISIMFAHQSTEAWTTLCNSILGARMNITGSWPMDTEMANRSLGLAGAALESSVTVACRPSERRGYADFADVKKSIRAVVKQEVEKLYGLGFRGADLLTACFGQAVSVFGHYKTVETSEGDPVSIGQLLAFARESAALALLEGVPGEPQTKFYCGWLQINGMKPCDFDDVNKFTRVGINVEIRQLQQDRLLIAEGNQQHLANAEEHLAENDRWGTQPTDYLISQAHRLMVTYRAGDDVRLNRYVRDLCQQSDAPLWRVLDFLQGHLPEGKDLEAVKGLLRDAEMLRQRSKENPKPTEGKLDF